MPTLKILKILQLTMFKLIEPQREEEELTELMVELAHIFQANVMLNFGPAKNQLMSKKKEKVNKLLKGKSQSEKEND